MNDKLAKEIAKELRLIRIELQKANMPPQSVEQEPQKEMVYDENEVRAGERVTF